jgi:hypothetical protein
MQELAQDIVRTHQQSGDYTEFVRIMTTKAADDVKEDITLMTAISLTAMGIRWIQDEKGGLPWLAGSKKGKEAYTYIINELRNEPGTASSAAVNEIQKKFDEYSTKLTEEKTKAAIGTSLVNKDLALTPK